MRAFSIISVQIAEQKIVGAVLVARPALENRLDILPPAEPLLGLRHERHIAPIHLGRSTLGDTHQHAEHQPP